MKSQFLTLCSRMATMCDLDLSFSKSEFIKPKPAWFPLVETRDRYTLCLHFTLRLFHLITKTQDIDEHFYRKCWSFFLFARVLK